MVKFKENVPHIIGQINKSILLLLLKFEIFMLPKWKDAARQKTPQDQSLNSMKISPHKVYEVPWNQYVTPKIINFSYYFPWSNITWSHTNWLSRWMDCSTLFIKKLKANFENPVLVTSGSNEFPFLQIVLVVLTPILSIMAQSMKEASPQVN